MVLCGDLTHLLVKEALHILMINIYCKTARDEQFYMYTYNKHYMA